ncbi:hypothetical protein TMUPMC115_0634 [Tetragenococcus muriaticus PMC-11-5]|uniref:Uncharacterized protein n=2 Tax=Tetragenococcus muriaticus TaxID=64642 RepID=A0A091C382_9ENTE|nr:hypothetical protein TMU3MR103_0531 [Tetragenococcus muriaticus 3MR10-3]KFN93001.1 hypothetical protein TMUPMC115_0634 [Tetragenococcus muriaticus PMC-11-5]
MGNVIYLPTYLNLMNNLEKARSAFLVFFCVVKKEPLIAE